MINAATQHQGFLVPASFQSISRAPKGYLWYGPLFRELYETNEGPFYCYSGTSLLDSDYIAKVKNTPFPNIPFQFWYIANPLSE